jgi:hypothetical protein
MRILLCIMMFAVALSGYCSSSHATAIGKVTQQTQASDSGDTSKIDTQKKDTANGGDMKCHSCCSEHVVFNHGVEMESPLVTAARLSPLHAPSLKSDHRFSLLRPPKFSV